MHETVGDLADPAGAARPELRRCRAHYRRITPRAPARRRAGHPAARGHDVARARDRHRRWPSSERSRRRCVLPRLVLLRLRARLGPVPSHRGSDPPASATHLPGEELSITVHGRAVPIDVHGPSHGGFRQTLLDIYVPRYGPDWEQFLDSGVAYARIDAERMFTFFMRRPSADGSAGGELAPTAGRPP